MLLQWYQGNDHERYDFTPTRAAGPGRGKEGGSL